VRSGVIVIQSPPFRNVLRLLRTQKQFEIQQFIPQLPVERLDVRLLPRATRLIAAVLEDTLLDASAPVEAIRRLVNPPDTEPLAPIRFV
jgi:hypothetical protein